jgi:hypothetical protein
MISLPLARRLATAGVRWDPAEGDRFVIPNKNLDGTVFVVATMVVDVVGASGRNLIRFNGTVEWALDSILQEEVVWLPSEEQLRALLGGAFTCLRRDDDGYRVDLVVAGQSASVVAAEVADAYGRALLLLAAGETEAG